MSDFDELSRYLNSEITRTNQNNWDLSNAQKQYCDSAFVALLDLGVNYLLQRKKVTSEQAKTLRSAIGVVDNVAKFFLSSIGWW